MYTIGEILSVIVMGKNMNRGNIAGSIVFFVLSLFFVIAASQLPMMTNNGIPGPGIFPLIIGLIMLILSISLFINNISGVISRKEPGNNFIISIRSYFHSNHSIFYFILSMIVYRIFLDIFGFIISTVLLTFYLLHLFSFKNGVFFRLLISISITLPVYFTFQYFLNVPLNFGLIRIIL